MDNYDVYFDERDERDDWVNLSEPEFPLQQKSVEDEADKKEKNTESFTRREIKSPILTFQLVVSLLIIISILIIKSFLPEHYYKFIHFYDAQMSRSMYSDGDFSSLDYSEFFSSTADETEYD